MVKRATHGLKVFVARCPATGFATSEPIVEGIVERAYRGRNRVSYLLVRVAGGHLWDCFASTCFRHKADAEAAAAKGTKS